MPSSDDEARRELQAMLEARDLTPTQLARRIGKDPGFVWRKLRTNVSISVTDYHLMREALEAVAPVPRVEAVVREDA